MEQDAILHFRNKQVKLTLNNGFNLIGTILEVYQKTILFKTTQAESLIPIDNIYSVVGR